MPKLELCHPPVRETPFQIAGEGNCGSGPRDLPRFPPPDEDVATVPVLPPTIIEMPLDALLCVKTYVTGRVDVRAKGYRHQARYHLGARAGGEVRASEPIFPASCRFRRTKHMYTLLFCSAGKSQSRDQSIVRRKIRSVIFSKAPRSVIKSYRPSSTCRSNQPVSVMEYETPSINFGSRPVKRHIWFWGRGTVRLLRNRTPSRWILALFLRHDGAKTRKATFEGSSGCTPPQSVLGPAQIWSPPQCPLWFT